MDEGATKASERPDGNEKDPLRSVKEHLVKGRTRPYYKTKEERSSLLSIFLIDSSGSMAKERQIAYIKGVLESTVQSYKDRRLRFASISLLDGDAELLSPPSNKLDPLLEAVRNLRTGGRTNLLAGLKKADALIREEERRQGNKGKKGIRLFILTDGRINAGDEEDPFGAAVDFYKRKLVLGKACTVVDTESGAVKLGEAEKLAERIGAKKASLFEEA